MEFITIKCIHCASSYVEIIRVCHYDRHQFHCFRISCKCTGKQNQCCL